MSSDHYSISRKNAKRNRLGGDAGKDKGTFKFTIQDMPNSCALYGLSQQEIEKDFRKIKGKLNNGDYKPDDGIYIPTTQYYGRSFPQNEVRHLDWCEIANDPNFQAIQNYEGDEELITKCLLETQKKRESANFRYMALRQAYMEELIYLQQEKKTSIETLNLLNLEIKSLNKEVEHLHSATMNNRNIFTKIQFLHNKVRELELKNNELEKLLNNNNNNNNIISSVRYNPHTMVITPYGEGEVIEQISNKEVKVQYPFGFGLININSITPFVQSNSNERSRGGARNHNNNNNNNNNINNLENEIENDLECEGIEIPSIITQPLPTNQNFHFYSQTNSEIPYDIESRNTVNPDYEKWENDKQKLKDIQGEYRRAEEANYILMSTQKQVYQSNEMMKQKLDSCLSDLQQLRQDNKFLQDKLESLTGQKWKGIDNTMMIPPQLDSRQFQLHNQQQQQQDHFLPPPTAANGSQQLIQQQQQQQQDDYETSSAHTTSSTGSSSKKNHKNYHHNHNTHHNNNNSNNNNNGYVEGDDEKEEEEESIPYNFMSGLKQTKIIEDSNSNDGNNSSSNNNNEEEEEKNIESEAGNVNVSEVEQNENEDKEEMMMMMEEEPSENESEINVKSEPKQQQQQQQQQKQKEEYDEESSNIIKVKEEKEKEINNDKDTEKSSSITTPTSATSEEDSNNNSNSNKENGKNDDLRDENFSPSHTKKGGYKRRRNSNKDANDLYEEEISSSRKKPKISDDENEDNHANKRMSRRKKRN